MKSFKVALWGIFFILLSASSIWSYPWPMRNRAGNFDGPLIVSATLGDARGDVGRPRFHRGIDIGGMDTITRDRNVYSLETGTVRYIRDRAGRAIGLYIGNYRYIHLTRMFIEGGSVVRDVSSENPQRIGVVSGDHLHFEIGSANGPFHNPLSYNNGPNNYDDTGMPIVWGSGTYRIDEVNVDCWWFWEEGSEGEGRRRRIQLPEVDERKPIYGKIEIRAYCRDRQNNPLLPGEERRSGIYRTQWGVRNSQNNWIIPLADTIIFPQVQPPNDGDPVLLVYDRHNYRDTSPFYYWVTNPIINHQVEDRYWNTKLRRGQAWNRDPARINAEAEYPDGRYTVWVLAYDIRDNGGNMDTRQGAEDEEVVIDNFRPYVHQVTIAQGEGEDRRTRYNAYWDFANDILTLTPNTQEERNLEPLRSGNATFRIEFSEPVQNPTASLAGRKLFYS
ncbi:TPA: hypothetical protein DCX15_02835 [bacterium]|nr:hypothetical protein [bacterium]